jgi:hypothetical protein
MSKFFLSFLVILTLSWNAFASAVEFTFLNSSNNSSLNSTHVTNTTPFGVPGWNYEYTNGVHISSVHVTICEDDILSIGVRHFGGSLSGKVDIDFPSGNQIGGPTSFPHSLVNMNTVFDFKYNSIGLRTMEIDYYDNNILGYKYIIHFTVRAKQLNLTVLGDEIDDCDMPSNYSFQLGNIVGFWSIPEQASVANVAYTITAPDGSTFSTANNNTAPYNSSFSPSEFGYYTITAVVTYHCGNTPTTHTKTVLFGEPFDFTNLTISNNQTWTNGFGMFSGTNTIKVLHNLIISSNVTLTVNPGIQLEFGENGELIIEPGGKLIANGTTFTSFGVCSNKKNWKGIHNKGYLELNNACVVEKSEDYGAYVDGNGVVNIKNTTFRNNLIGLGFVTGNANNEQRVETSTFDLNYTFTNVNTTGIYAKSTFFGRSDKGVHLTAVDCNFNYAGTGNRGNGFELENAFVNIEHCNFNRLKTGVNGLFTTEIVGDRLFILDPQMTQCFDGINLSGTGKNVVIDGGNITWVGSFTSSQEGVRIDGVKQVDIKNVTFNGYFRGLYLLNTCTSTSEWSNVMYNKFDLGNRAMQLQGNNSKLNIACNEFRASTSTTILHIYVRDGSFANQGNSSSPIKNLFIGNAPNLGDIYTNLSFQYHYFNPTNGGATLADYKPTITSNAGNVIYGVNQPFPAVGVCPNFLRAPIGTAEEEIQEIITEDIKESNVMNYPNPFSTSTTIMFSLKGDQGTVQVFDMTGKVVFSQDVNENEGEITLERGSMMPGVYFIQTSENGAFSARNKMIINE